MRMAPATPVFAGEPAPTGAVQVSRFWLRQLLLQVGHKPWGRRCSCGNGRARSHSDRARFQGFRWDRCLCRGGTGPGVDAISEGARELSKVTIQTDESRLITLLPHGTFRRIAIILRRLANTSARKRSAQKMRPDSLFENIFCQRFSSLSSPFRTQSLGLEPPSPAPKTRCQYHSAIIAQRHKTGKKSPPSPELLPQRGALLGIAGNTIFICQHPNSLQPKGDFSGPRHRRFRTIKQAHGRCTNDTDIRCRSTDQAA